MLNFSMKSEELEQPEDTEEYELYDVKYEDDDEPLSPDVQM